MTLTLYKPVSSGFSESHQDNTKKGKEESRHHGEVTEAEGSGVSYIYGSHYYNRCLVHVVGGHTGHTYIHMTYIVAGGDRDTHWEIGRRLEM